MAFSFAKKGTAANRPELKRITTWVEDALPDSMDDAMVMVNELQCYEPVRRGRALYDYAFLCFLPHRVSCRVVRRLKPL